MNERPRYNCIHPFPPSLFFFLNPVSHYIGLFIIPTLTDLSDTELNVKFNIRLMVLMKNISHLTLLLYVQI